MDKAKELNLLGLEADLYDAWQALKKGNNGTATTKMATCWSAVHLQRLACEQRNLPSTHDTHLRARALKAIYRILNLWPLRCRHEFNCEWVYPYGFVPEAGCPYHD